MYVVSTWSGKMLFKRSHEATPYKNFILNYLYFAKRVKKNKSVINNITFFCYYKQFHFVIKYKQKLCITFTTFNPITCTLLGKSIWLIGNTEQNPIKKIYFCLYLYIIVMKAILCNLSFCKVYSIEMCVYVCVLVCWIYERGIYTYNTTMGGYSNLKR